MTNFPDFTDKDMQYALRVLRNASLRKTDDFKNWIQVPEHKEMLLDLMASREALLREEHSKESKATTPIAQKHKSQSFIYKYIAATAAIAATVVLVLLLTPSSTGEQSKALRVFAATTTPKGVTLQVDGEPLQILSDSILHMPAIIETDSIEYQTLTIPRGQKFKLILADGTTVWLNGDSRLRYPSSFGKDSRRVELDGEACFDVTRNVDSPFLVQSGNMDIRVLGTMFNVRNYNPSDCHVTLVHGSVLVNKSGNEVTLEPGQDVTYNTNGQPQVSEVNVATFTAWTEGMFYFEDEPLENIMQTLDRWYNVNVDFQDKRLRDIRLNFWARRDDSVSTTLQLLDKLRIINTNYTNGTITIEAVK